MKRLHRQLSRAATVSFDEMWTYVGARRGENRRSVRIWTAVVEEWDGSRWADFEVGGRDMETFVRLLRRLPKAAKYRSGHYEGVQPLASGKSRKGEGQRGEPERGLHSNLSVNLNRLVRRTHGYSKRLYMLIGSLAMVWLRDGLYQRQRV